MSRKSGFLGALGEQPPGATRPAKPPRAEHLASLATRNFQEFEDVSLMAAWSIVCALLSERNSPSRLCTSRRMERRAGSSADFDCAALS